MAQWPSVNASVVDLLEVKNRASTTLSSAIDNAVTIIPVVSTTLFPATGVITIDNERIRYVEKDATHFGTIANPATRSYDSSSAAPHNNAAATYGNICAAHHSLLSAEIVAIEANAPKLGSVNTFTANQIIANTAPSITLQDTTASAKSLLIKTDGDKSYLQELVGADGSLVTLDLANGRVGIGTTPANLLHVAGASAEMKIQASSGRGAISVLSDSGDANVVLIAASNWSLATKRSTDSFILSNNYQPGSNDFFTVTKAGLVGIGTTSPGAKLHVTTATTTDIIAILKGAASHTGDLLQAQDSSANVLFSVGATGALKCTSSEIHFYRAITALRTLDATDYIIDCTANTFSVTLPTAVGIQGRTYIIKNSGTGVITIATTSSQTIDGETTLVLGVQNESLKVVSDNANWKVV